MNKFITCGICFCFLVGCGPKEVDIQGEIFVVTAGAQNIKLGLVQVDIISESTMVPFITAKILSAQQSKRELRLIVERLKQESDRLRTKYEDHVATLKTIMDIQAITGGGYTPPSYELMTRMDEEKKEFEAKRFEYETVLLAGKNTFDKGEYYIEGSPAALQSSKTNADGNFSLKIKEGRYALVAHSTRDIGGSTEHYCWILWISVKSGEANKIILSNDNLFETNCTECVVKVSDIPYE